MQLSERAQHNQPSMTMALIALAKEKQARGESVIAMIAGEPDFPTPDNICMAGIRAIVTGDTKYGTATGTPALRQAIADKLACDNGLSFTPGQVVVATGSKPLLYTAFMAICDPGAEVIVPAPYWVSYPALVTLAGATAVPLAGSEASGFKITPSQLRAAITPRTRAVLLNTPNNPSGAVYSQEEQTALLDVLRDHPGIWLVTDEIYEHLVYDGQRHCSPASLAPDLADRIIVINGFSKGYGMIGWRLGFAAGPAPVMTAMGDFLSHLLGAPSSITQAAALAALVEPQPYLASNCADYQARRDLALELLGRIPGLQCAPPLGAFFLFVNCAACFGKVSPKGERINNDADFARAVLNEAGVALVPGTAFGCPGYFRLSYSIAADDIRTALDRLTVFCATLS